jgi:putative hemin transport protein
MEMWSQDVVDAEVEGFVEFGSDELGSFQFAYVSGEIDYRDGSRNGKPSVEWSWDGNDEMDPAKGNGWAVIDGDQIHGVIAIHHADQSQFEAIRWDKTGAIKRALRRPVRKTLKLNPIHSRIRTAIEKNPRRMTLQLARDLGMPEVEVIRAFPPDRVTELDTARWEELLRSLEALGSVRVLVSNGATTIEVDGQFGGFSKAGEFFNVQTDTLDLHIRWEQLAAIFAVEKPGHMDGMATRSIQFFDQTGDAALKIFLNFGGPIQPEREDWFIDVRTRFKARQ